MTEAHEPEYWLLLSEREVWQLAGGVLLASVSTKAQALMEPVEDVAKRNAKKPVRLSKTALQQLLSPVRD